RAGAGATWLTFGGLGGISPPLCGWRRSSAVEQGNHNPLVGGSNPPAATIQIQILICLRSLFTKPPNLTGLQRRPDSRGQPQVALPASPIVLPCPPPHLRPATREEPMQSLSFAVSFNGRKRPRDAA